MKKSRQEADQNHRLQLSILNSAENYQKEVATSVTANHMQNIP